jgi:nucleotide-binding universal stress UspA family protein
METYRIVVGIDGSEGSDRGLDWALAEAAARIGYGQPAAVGAVTAWDFDPDLEPESVVVRLEDPRNAAERTLERAVRRAIEAHPAAVIAAEAVRGKTSDVLVRAADRANLLVLGSHGHTHLFHAALGSVAEACIRSATCPVVVIPTARATSSRAASTNLAPSGR